MCVFTRELDRVGSPMLGFVHRDRFGMVPKRMFLWAWLW